MSPHSWAFSVKSLSRTGRPWEVWEREDGGGLKEGREDRKREGKSEREKEEGRRKDGGEGEEGREGGWVGKYEGRREDGRREDEEWWRGGGEGEEEREEGASCNLSQGRRLTYHSQSD